MHGAGKTGTNTGDDNECKRAHLCVVEAKTSGSTEHF